MSSGIVVRSRWLEHKTPKSSMAKKNIKEKKKNQTLKFSTFDSKLGFKTLRLYFLAVCIRARCFVFENMGMI